MSTRIEISPGGMLPPAQIVGRTALIATLFDHLRVQSVALVAPRRMGKSHVLVKMEAEPAAGFLVHRYSLEHLDSVGAFVEKVYQEAARSVSTVTVLRRTADAWIQRLRGKVNLGGLAVELEGGPWQDLLGAVLDDLEAHAVEHQRVQVLAWDEFTWFLHKLAERDRAADAVTLLELLRTFRQDGRHRHVRFVFTGSIGLEEVLDRLQGDGLARAPLNDVDRVVLPLLDRDSATELAAGLVRVGVPEGDPTVAAALAVASEGHPLFLHLLARHLHTRRSWSAAAVDLALTALLEDDQDPMELDAWIERIALYRPGRRPLIEAVLDALSTEPATVDALIAATGIARGDVADVLKFLRRDLYVTQSGGTHRFRMDVLRRFWRSHRGLL